MAISSVAIASYVSNAPALVALGSVVGIIFVLCVAFGNKYANVFGALCAITFGYFSLEQGFFGNAVVQLMFVLPMSLYGIYAWSKRSKSEVGIKRSLSNCDRANFVSAAVALLAVAFMFSFSTGANMPIADAVTTMLPILGTFLLVNAYKEQWYVWITYNFIEVLMWFAVLSVAPDMLAVLVMRVVFFLNSLIGAYEWRKS